MAGPGSVLLQEEREGWGEREGEEIMTVLYVLCTVNRGACASMARR